MKGLSLRRPFISHKGKLSPRPSILGPIDPPWESEISLRVVCRLEVALFAALPRQSIREKEALSVPPCPLLFGRPAENPSGLPLVRDFPSQKAVVSHFRHRQAGPSAVLQVSSEETQESKC